MVPLGNRPCIRGKNTFLSKHRSFLSLCLSVVMILEGQSRYILVFNLTDKKVEPLFYLSSSMEKCSLFCFQSSSLLFFAS